MRWRDWLERWEMSGLQVSAAVLDGPWQPQEADRAAAWELYVELLTRTSAHPLEADTGDEETALESVHALFHVTREILKRHGPGCIEFAKIAVLVLDQVIRPFTTRWHQAALAAEFKRGEMRSRFRTELADLQVELRKYTRMLADMADVEDLTALEDDEA